MKYRKKPVVIEAFRFGKRGVCDDPLPGWATDALDSEKMKVWVESGNLYLQIATLEGVMRADEGDFVIRGVKGEIYPCKPDIFAETYETA